jgi:hypothetical protein
LKPGAFRNRDRLVVTGMTAAMDQHRRPSHWFRSRPACGRWRGSLTGSPGGVIARG